MKQLEYDNIYNGAGGYIQQFALPNLDPDCEKSDEWLSLVHALDPFECPATQLEELHATAPSDEAQNFIVRIAEFRNLQLGLKNG